MIEKPLPLREPTNGTSGSIAREERTSYGGGKQLMDSGAMMSLDARSRDHYRSGNGRNTDHVITEVGASRRNRITPSLSAKHWGVPEKKPSRRLSCLSFATNPMDEAGLGWSVK